VVDVREAFAGVVDAFVAAYAAGRTPNPCVACNRDVKFGRLREIATALGCEAVATGHYARLAGGPDGRRRLLRAVDRRKDQTYVLHPLDQPRLAAARFPLGDTTKEAVRAEARALGLPVADKRDSQDLCFVPGGDVAAFLGRRAPEALVPGDVVDEDGRALGRHGGAAAFTIGQRRGLPAAGRARYVARVEPAGGRVEVAGRRALERDVIEVRDVNWIDVAPPAPGATFVVEAQVRHAAPATSARLQVGASGGVRVTFDAPVFAPAPGQALVAWVGEAVLCGGTIERGEGSAAPDGAESAATRGGP
jgi:tRNA-specific 2-thiouridylase